MTTDQTAYVEVLARLLCAADVHVHDGDHPTWHQLNVVQHGRGQDDYRKAARWLAERLTVTAETRLSRAERRCEELREESKRRGKKVLEYSEKNRALEREIDGIQRKLGAEILRANEAEATVERAREIARRLAAHAAGFQDVLDESDRGPWGRMVGADITALRTALDEPVTQTPPAPTDRAAVLREAADRIDATDLPQDFVDMFDNGARWATAELRRMAVEAAVPGRTTDETPASIAPLAAGLPLVQGQCPACGRASLFLGSGGYVTCSVAKCPEPDAASTVLERPAAGGAQQPTEDRPPVAYSDGRGRVYCLPCSPRVGADVPLTVEDVGDWELCPSCGRHVVDVARETAQPKETRP
jgi:hypothetical protein